MQNNYNNSSTTHEKLNNVSQWGDAHSISVLLKQEDFKYLTDNYNNNLLHLACKYNNLALVEEIFESNSNFNINSTNEFGYTPLHYAILSKNIDSLYTKNTDLVDFLLKKGANLSAMTENGDTPLHFASKTANIDIFNLLIDKIISEYSHFNLLVAKNNKGEIPLHCSLKSIEIIQSFVNHGIDINFQDNDGNTLLYNSCNAMNDNVAEYLLNIGANPNIQNKDGDTPLHLIASDCKEKMIDKLIEHNANVNMQNNKSEAPIHFLCNRSNVSSFTKLINNGADINIQNNEGNTPLHLASQVQSFETIKLLFANNVQVNIKNNESLTPFDIINNSDEFANNHITKDIIAAFQTYEQYNAIKEKYDDIKKTLSCMGIPKSSSEKYQVNQKSKI